MKKFLIPAICVLISFSFSGKHLSKTLPSPECGPTITIQNAVGAATITKVEVKILASGIVHTYNSPTFPFVYAGSGGNLRITYYFSGPRTGILVWDDGVNCDIEFYFANIDPYIEFFAGCGNYTVSNGGNGCD